MPDPRLTDWAERRLYAIVDLGYVAPEKAEEAAAALLEGGAGVLQLRAKGHGHALIEGLARKLVGLCRAANVPFVLNDFPHLAAAVGADGVHLGQDDGSLAAARDICGKDFLFGRSTHSLEQARAALEEGFDYIGFGPLFPTPTKLGRPAIGLEGLGQVEAAVGRSIPVFAIGGIVPATLPAVLAAGASRVVVVSALLQAPDVAAATRQLCAQLAAAHHQLDPFGNQSLDTCQKAVLTRPCNETTAPIHPCPCGTSVCRH
jgi:thiamine-phosphate pyrophosphorylase